MRHPLLHLDKVTLGRGDSRAATQSACELAVMVPDSWMSTRHARLGKALGHWVLEDLGSKNGTFVNGRRAARTVLSDGDVIEVGRTFFLFRSRAAVAPAAPRVASASAHTATESLSTLNPELEASYAALERVAASDVSVVIQGESGTGKELAAKAVHGLSGRPGPMVAVNCGGIAPTLVESELFGHRKGAFSGADRHRVGLIQSADRGTLFLDELGDLPSRAQAALLRALQERAVLPLGETRPVPVDLRLVVATHRDLESMAAEGSFRADLLARISGFALTLPPLRERREDLGLLLALLLHRLGPQRAEGVSLAPEAARALLGYGWPLNIRELEKALGAAVVLAGDRPIGIEHLPPAIRQAKAAAPSACAMPRARANLSASDLALREELIARLTQHHGNVSEVARLMGKARMQIQRWMHRLGLEPASFRR